MVFDGLRDVFRALGVEIVARKVEGRQRPDGGYGRCTAVWTVQVLAKRSNVMESRWRRQLVIPLTCTQGELLRCVWNLQHEAC